MAIIEFPSDRHALTLDGTLHLDLMNGSVGKLINRNNGLWDTASTEVLFRTYYKQQASKQYLNMLGLSALREDAYLIRQIAKLATSKGFVTGVFYGLCDSVGIKTLWLAGMTETQPEIVWERGFVPQDARGSVFHLVIVGTLARLLEVDLFTLRRLPGGVFEARVAQRGITQISRPLTFDEAFRAACEFPDVEQFSISFFDSSRDVALLPLRAG